MLLDRTTQQNTYSETNTDGGKAIFLICKNKPRQNRLISKHSVLLSQIYSLNLFFSNANLLMFLLIGLRNGLSTADEPT